MSALFTSEALLPKQLYRFGSLGRLSTLMR